MNSMSKYYNNDCDPCNKENYYKDNCDPYKKQTDNQKTIIKCGFPSSTTLPLALVTSVGTTFNLSSLTLDTCSLRNPSIKLEFASNIITDGVFVGSLTLQVFKQCGNQINPTPVGPSFTLTEIAALTARTFSFFVCDCDSCFKDCCTYTVVATVNSVIAAGTLSVNNATLGAIATSGNNSCC